MGHHNIVSRSRNAAIIVLSFAILILPIAQTVGHAQGQSTSDASSIPGRLANSQDRTRELNVYSLAATGNGAGVFLQWHTTFELDNVGFDIYRVRNGQRLRANQSIVPGSLFIVGQDVPLRAGYSYAWFDAGGSDDAVYYIESIGLDGIHKLHEKGASVSRGKLPDYQTEGSSSRQLNSTPPGISEFPAASAPGGVQSAQGSIQKQWELAGQPALKIQIKKDAWYRVTQQQMTAVGFSPVVQIQNLSLFVNAQEIAIRTSKSSGQFVSGDYLEFYGQGVDQRETDSQVYYLVAGTQPGQRVANNIEITAAGDQPISNRDQEPTSTGGQLDLIYRGSFLPLINFRSRGEALTAGNETEKERLVSPAGPSIEVLIAKSQLADLIPSATATDAKTEGEVRAVKSAVAESPKVPSTSKSTSTSTSRATDRPAALRLPPPVVKNRKRKLRRKVKTVKQRYAHAVSEQAAAAVLSFDATVQLKERFNYFISLLNGDADNHFGAVVGSGGVNQTLTVHNVQAGADGPSRLEIALQGVSLQPHQINVSLNGVFLGAINSFARDHAVQTYNIAATPLLEGDNIVKLQSAASNDVSIVDYVRLTYQHSYTADGNSLRFNLRPAQTAQITGFSVPNVMLLDISDPTRVTATSLVTSAGAITVPPAPRKKQRVPVFTAPELQPLRTLYALPQGQFDQVAGLSLNQPSTLNQSTNGADLLIISHKDFVPSLSKPFLPANTSFVAQRQGQNLTVKVVDVEDVFDEFSFGAHGAQALKEFLLRANTTWTKAPSYVLLVGDASYDPRNFQTMPGGPFDFVPTQLVDTIFGEACSDDSLADFDGDGIPGLAVGRLPARTSAEADLMLSKIVNFSKANVPQTAMLVADAQGDYPFSFSQANVEIGALLPQSVTKQFVNRGETPTPTSDAAVNATIISTFNQGVALANYSGHGNVDVWSGAPLFTATQARALTNGNKLSFVFVENCLNGLFDDPGLEGIGEALVKAPNGGAVATFSSSAETVANGQHDMAKKFYELVYGGSQSVTLGDAIKQAKAFTNDVDVRRTWILLGDPTMKIW